MSPCSDDGYEPTPAGVGEVQSVHQKRHLGGRMVEEVYDVDDEVRFCYLKCTIQDMQLTFCAQAVVIVPLYPYP